MWDKSVPNRQGIDYLVGGQGSCAKKGVTVPKVSRCRCFVDWTSEPEQTMGSKMNNLLANIEMSAIAVTSNPRVSQQDD